MDTTTLILGAVILVGLGFEALKHVDPSEDPSTQAQIRPLQWEEANNGSNPRPTLASAHPNVSEQDNGTPTPGTPFIAQANNANKTPVNTTAANKKKKKKKKKEAKKTAPVAEVAKPKMEPKKADSYPLGVGGIASGANPPADPKAKDEKRDLRDWEDFILTNPSYENTLQMIEAYRSHQITDEVFYTVVDEMLADSREEIRRYGVVALQGTPSVASLTRLEMHAQVEVSGSRAKQLTDSALNAYSMPQYLPILAQAITASSNQNQALAIMAIQRVRTAAQSHLATSGTQTSGSSRNPRESRGNAHVNSYLAALDRLLPTLESLAQSYPNTQIGQEAAATATLIKRLQNT